MTDQKQTAQKQMQAIYLPTDFYLLRVPALPAHIFRQLSTTGHVALTKNTDQPGAMWRERTARCYQLLRELALQPNIAQAIAVASPALQLGLERLQRDEGTSATQKRPMPACCAM